MTKPLCFPVTDELGLHIATQSEDGRLTRSHALNFAECKALVEHGIAQMQKLYVQEKCKCE